MKTKMTSRAHRTLQIEKLVGAGNDFLFINLKDNQNKNKMRRLEKLTTREELARRLCRRQESIGADGLIFIEPTKGTFEFAWDFYNSDGSRAEMCGNAARCAIRFAKDILGVKKKVIYFLTSAGPIRGEVVGKSRVAVFLQMPKIYHENLSISALGKKWTGTFLNSGVPHFVVEAKDFSNTDIAKAIQTHKIFGSEQTNVTFIEIFKKNKIRAVTFERGLGAFSKACGTGAVAAASTLAEKTKTQDEIAVEMPGGILRVSFDESENATRLEGEARLVATVELHPEGFYG